MQPPTLFLEASASRRTGLLDLMLCSLNKMGHNEGGEKISGIFGMSLDMYRTAVLITTLTDRSNVHLARNTKQPLLKSWQSIRWSKIEARPVLRHPPSTFRSLNLSLPYQLIICINVTSCLSHACYMPDNLIDRKTHVVRNYFTIMSDGIWRKSP